MSLAQQIRSLWNPTEALLKEIQSAPLTLPSNKLIQHLKFKLDRKLGVPVVGSSQGLFKGHGLDFQGLQQYQPGDDLRKLDWNVYARTGTPHIRTYYEEKQVSVWFIVDALPSMHLGQKQAKLAYVQQLMSLLGLLAFESDYKVGMLLWDGSSQVSCIRPQRSITHLEFLSHRIYQALEEDTPEVSFSPLPQWSNFLDSRSVVFFISDFIFLHTHPEGLQSLSKLVPKHQLTSLMITDPMDMTLPAHHGVLPFTGLSKSQTQWVNTNTVNTVETYPKTAQQWVTSVQAKLQKWGVAHIISTAQDPVNTVVQWAKGTRS